jgi:hypothetical protein
MEVLGVIMNTTPSQVEREKDFILDQLSFPPLNGAQVQLLLSMKVNHWMELLRWISLQISAETYQFSILPLCMKETLSLKETQLIESSLLKMHRTDGLELTKDRMDEFICNSNNKLVTAGASNLLLPLLLLLSPQAAAVFLLFLFLLSVVADSLLLLLWER